MSQSTDRIAQFTAMLEKGMDNAMLQYSLGNEYFQLAQYPAAMDHLRKALAHNPKYSAAWKLLGKPLAANEQLQQAIETFDEGIEIAKSTGDIQASKEMTVFRKRVLKTSGSSLIPALQTTLQRLKN